MVVGAVAVHDEIVRRRPDLAAVLHDGPWWHKQMVGDGTVRYSEHAFWLMDNGRLFTRYGHAYIEAAHAHADVPDLTATQLEALDLFDAVASSPDFRLDMDFEPGDVQFLNNYVMMHSRAAYDDWPDPARRRDLCRLWLIAEELDLPPRIAETGVMPRSTAFQREPSPGA